MALFVQEGDDAHGPEGQQVQGGPVVAVVDVVPGDALRAALLLLRGEHVLHEELLQLLVGEVDAELLKAADATPPRGWRVSPVPPPSGPSGAPAACTDMLSDAILIFTLTSCDSSP